jgi:DNA-binding transcriptional regulator PaaX
MGKFTKTSVAGHILEQFLKPKFKYKGISVNIFGLPSFRSNYSKRTFSNELSRLKREKFIEEEKDSESLRITRKGQEYIKRRQSSLSVFSFSFPKSSPKNLIVMFDIPEPKKAEREWFRYHLKKFGYEMIQRSVWVGPSPLPPEFLAYLKYIKLTKCVKTFKLAKSYQNKSSF